MEIVPITILTDELKESVLKLWNQEYPVNLKLPAMAELDNYLNSIKEAEHLFLMDDKKQVHGWAFSYSRQDGRWFAMLLNSEMQKKGYGTKILNQLKLHGELNGWIIEHDNYLKSNNKPYKSPLNFYIKNEFIHRFDIRLEFEHLTVVKIEWKKGMNNDLFHTQNTHLHTFIMKPIPLST